MCFNIGWLPFTILLKKVACFGIGQLVNTFAYLMVKLRMRKGDNESGPLELDASNMDLILNCELVFDNNCNLVMNY